MKVLKKTIREVLEEPFYPVQGAIDVDEWREFVEETDAPLATRTPAQLLEEAECAAALQRAVAALTDREQTVLCRYFGLGGEEAHTHKEVGRQLGVSGARSYEIMQKALRKLRHPHWGKHWGGYFSPHYEGDPWERAAIDWAERERIYAGLLAMQAWQREYAVQRMQEEKDRIAAVKTVQRREAQQAEELNRKMEAASQLARQQECEREAVKADLRQRRAQWKRDHGYSMKEEEYGPYNDIAGLFDGDAD